MQNIPRLYIDEILNTGKTITADKDIVHYLRRVMRTAACLVFNGGDEYAAELSTDNKNIIVGEKTSHIDPSNNLTLYFAPIKKIDELVNMATQMGVGTFVPVITKRTVANHINWTRVKKIMIEASEQSNRNSIPKLMEPIKFDELDLNNMIVADERFAHNKPDTKSKISGTRLLIGPEGGFAPEEFEKMDKSNVCSVALGKTILRAETAAIVAIAKVLNQ